MRTRGSASRLVRVSWLASVSVVTVLATLGITLVPESRQNHRGVNYSQTSNSVLAPLGTPAIRPALAANYGNLPLAFEANQGQADGRVSFISRGRGYTMLLAGDQAVLSLTKPSAKRNSRLEIRNPKITPPTADVLRMKLVGANALSAARGKDRLPGVSNYYIGNDPRKWRTNVPNYAKVHYDGVYPGVDLVYYGNQRQLEYDFEVAPGANPHAIELSFEGLKNEKRLATIDAKGDLVITAGVGEVRFHKPVVYQQLSAGTRMPIEGKFKLLAENLVGFEVGAYDKTKPLIIDPTLGYATYLGGSSFDAPQAIAADSAGYAYITGITGSTDFPVSSGTAPGGGDDCFITKLNPTGTARVFSSYVGGTGTEEAYGIALDGSNNIYLAGDTFSTDFPGASGGDSTNGDAFVTKLDSTGAQVFTKLLGGTGVDVAQAVKADSSGNLYVIGSTTSSGLPIVNGFQSTCASCGASMNDAFVAKVKFDGTAVLYSSFLGGSTGEQFPGERGRGIVIDVSGKMYVIGTTSATDFPTKNSSSTYGGGISDTFLAEIDPAQSGAASLLFSTYIGDAGEDIGNGIAIDNSGKVYIAGLTDVADTSNIGAPGFQTTNAGLLDAFVAKVDPSNATYIYATLLGGSEDDDAASIAVDSSGNAFVTGTTYSSDFPKASAVDSTFNVSALGDTYVTEIAADGMSLVFSTYLGGEGQDVGQSIAVSSTGQIFVTGNTDSSDFPATAGVVQTACADTGGCTQYIGDGFVASYGAAVASGPQATATPSGLAFGNVAINGTSTKVVQIKNTGTTTLNLSSIGLSGADAANFAIDGATTTCTNSSALAADASCNVGVAFTPSAEVSYSASLDIGSNDPNTPTHIPLTGAGIPSAATIDVSPASLDFGSAQVGSNIDYPVTVTNTGTEDLILSAITVSGADAANFTGPGAGSTCSVGAHIAPDASCDITVVFHSTAVATFNATLTITSNAANAPSASGPLTGSGSDFQFDVQPGGSTSDTVSAGQTAVFNLQIGGTPGAAGTATLGCTENIPNGQCGVQPASVVLNDTTPSRFIASFTSTAPPSQGRTPLTVPNTGPGGPKPWPAIWMWVAALALMLGTMAASRRRARLVMLAATLYVVLWSSCVGNSPSATTSRTTPSGVYAVTATATVNGVTKSFPLSVTVN